MRMTVRFKGYKTRSSEAEKFTDPILVAVVPRVGERVFHRGLWFSVSDVEHHTPAAGAPTANTSFPGDIPKVVVDLQWPDQFQPTN